MMITMMIWQQSFVIVVWVTLVFHIPEIPGSSLRQKLNILTEVCNGFLSVFPKEHRNSSPHLKVSNDRLLPRCFQLIIRRSFYVSLDAVRS
jgi:hypothetical protein